jgi:DNA-binding transcriptional regulator YiaG
MDARVLNPGAALFRRCREALGLSAEAMAKRLYISGGGRAIRKWEAGEHRIPGPAWVVLRYMLDDAENRFELVNKIDALLAEHEAA